MISADKLTKYYGSFCAVDNISFEVKKGQILGLLGPNGAGKTTTLRMLTCYLSPTSGSALVKDIDVTENPLEVKKLIGYLPESAPLYQDMLVYDYLEYIAELRDIGKNMRKNRISDLADMCGLNSVMHKSINELSKGFKQRVGLAHAMTGSPEILVLDEPTSGLDPNQIIEIRELIKNLGKEKTVIFSSHILSEVEATCDRIVIINRGKIAADGSIEDLKKSASGGYNIRILLSSSDAAEFKKEISKITGVRSIKSSEEPGGNIMYNVECGTRDDLRPRIYKAIKNNDWQLLEFARESRTLENIFSLLTTEQDTQNINKEGDKI